MATIDLVREPPQPGAASQGRRPDDVRRTDDALGRRQRRGPPSPRRSGVRRRRPAQRAARGGARATAGPSRCTARRRAARRRIARSAAELLARTAARSRALAQPDVAPAWATRVMSTDAGRTHGGLGRGLASLIPTGHRRPAPATIARSPSRHRPQPVPAARPASTTSELARARREHRRARRPPAGPRHARSADGYQLIAGERRVARRRAGRARDASRPSSGPPTNRTSSRSRSSRTSSAPTSTRWTRRAPSGSSSTSSASPRSRSRGASGARGRRSPTRCGCSTRRPEVQRCRRGRTHQRRPRAAPSRASTTTPQQDWLSRSSTASGLSVRQTEQLVRERRARGARQRRARPRGRTTRPRPRAHEPRDCGRRSARR